MYSFHWDLQPDDYGFRPGHRIRVVVLSTDHDYTLRCPPETEVAVQPGVSEIRLPVAPAR
jgi:X-Pro dipeptidyl-peptidase